MARITIAGLRKTYTGAHHHHAVDGIDLAIRDGEVMALVGPSGCGKTTTLQLLAGFLKPDSGTIAVDGRIISSPQEVVPPERRHMSLIFQSYAVWPHKTVFENVAYGLRVRKLPRATIEEKVKRVLQSVRLTDLAQRYPSELSGGQQQRVALARAVVVEPATLLLDEPLSNLDANLREEMRFEIRRIHDTTGITMVYVTHDQTEAMVAADRIAIMNQGRIAQVGSAQEIYE
ncbi:MAG TPA: ABC transporter ATP-binding protein, partial [Candidatus Acidoferrum sp.]|nr:ABC transporter ATP-binding protein [Candidatus Acidoferrum sp.]